MSPKSYLLTMDMIIENMIGISMSPTEFLVKLVTEIFLVLIVLGHCYLMGRFVLKDRQKGRLEFTKIQWWINLFKTIFKHAQKQGKKPSFETYMKELNPVGEERLIKIE